MIIFGDFLYVETSSWTPNIILWTSGWEQFVSAEVKQLLEWKRIF
jgi:hypothetical protein